MDILKELLKQGININDIKTNSKQIQKGDLFVCTPGYIIDKHQYIEDAAKNGAVAAIVEKNVTSSIPTIKVTDINQQLYNALEKFYNYVNKKIKLIGVTGTDGKTTTSTIVYKILNRLDKCGYIGTNGIYCNDFYTKTINTTPSIDILYKSFSRFLDNGCKYVSIETSSAGLKQDRTGNLEFDIGIFTNLTYDHMDIHKTMDDYLNSKKKLFQKIKPEGFAIINLDDKYSKEIINSSKCNIITYGKNANADIKIIDAQLSKNYTNINIEYKNKKYNINTNLLGEFNVYNLCGAIGALIGLGYNINEIIQYVSDLSIENRMVKINLNQNFDVIVDYTHTVNGFKCMFDYLNKIKHGKIITVTGSIGNREYKERKEKGEVITNLSDYTIFTSDDCINENPKKILQEMTNELTNNNYEIVLDRKQAIQKAIAIAQQNDIVFIAGRCGEETMNIMGTEYECNDIAEAKKVIEEKMQIKPEIKKI